MDGSYAERVTRARNAQWLAFDSLCGIIQGLLADQQLNDIEIGFLRRWLAANHSVASEWPGNIIAEQIQRALADGVVTEQERAHLVETLRGIVGGAIEDFVESAKVCELALDKPETITFDSRLFCFTGDFVFGPRDVCEAAVVRRGGSIKASVSKKLHYLIVGGLGSAEWKHGSFGTKMRAAVNHRANGVPLLIVHEDVWAPALNTAAPVSTTVRKEPGLLTATTAVGEPIPRR